MGYRHIFADPVSREIIEELPVRDVSLADPLNAGGSFTLSLDMTNPALRKLAWERATEPWRSAYFCDLDGTLIYGGIITDAPYSSSDKMTKVSGVQPDAYFSHRALFGAAGDAPRHYVGVDSFAAFRSIITAMSGGITVRLGAETAGISVTRDYELYKTAADAFHELAELSTGFDFGFDPRYRPEDGRPEFLLSLSLARGSGNPEIILAKPGNIAAYTWPRGGDITTHATAVGAAPDSGGDAPAATYENPGMIAAGYPRLDKVTTYSSVTDPDVLAAHAEADAKAGRFALGAPTFDLAPGYGPAYPDYLTGDVARIEIDPDERFPVEIYPDGLRTSGRIVQRDLKIGFRGQSDQVTVTVDLAALTGGGVLNRPVSGRAGLALLASLRRRLYALEITR